MVGILPAIHFTTAPNTLQVKPCMALWSHTNTLRWKLIRLVVVITDKVLFCLTDRNLWHIALIGSLSIKQWENVKRARPCQLSKWTNEMWASCKFTIQWMGTGKWQWAQKVASLYCVALWWQKQERKTTKESQTEREKEERGMYLEHRARLITFMLNHACLN